MPNNDLYLNGRAQPNDRAEGDIFSAAPACALDGQVPIHDPSTIRFVGADHQLTRDRFLPGPASKLKCD
jgi:hypothetical protein